LARGFRRNRCRLEDRARRCGRKTDDYAHKLYYQSPTSAVVDRVSEIARRRGVKNMHVALAWVLARRASRHPSSASKMEH
jgi:aryl-alcohol dehydrogenase (NADP+)